MWQDNQSPYVQSNPSPYYTQPAQQPLQFYSAPSPGPSENGYYPGSRSSLEGNMGGVQGTMSSGGSGFGGNIQVQGPWWTAFGTGGLEGEPPLLEGESRGFPID